MQCCSVVILAAKPLPPAVAGEEYGGWRLGQGAGAALILPALDKSPGGSSEPGQPNGCNTQSGQHPNLGSCPPPPSKKELA
ncbi:hypothetical protein HU200_052603 [Digitaria exilis]|uniref:Uncharacterized protein n=1 Tax=Digitaria exilis TaxID=1010633 RepID=A0A835E999_9POAL|nr:hypothetical protein HU200_052603 [Digitaria exilis]